jgi:hypothetical protein
MFKQPKCMFYVDLQGNLLSNLKLAFYEKSADTGFFGKMIQDGNEKQKRDELVSAYKIFEEVYDDLLLP